MTEKQQTVGILYESDEWSDHKLAAELNRALAEEGCQAEAILIDMQLESAVSLALDCDMLISRIFASARFRGHAKALSNMTELLERANEAAIPMLNPGSAHLFEIDKSAAASALSQAGIDVPAIHVRAEASRIDADSLVYPCIIKPNCGGRTACTAVLDSPSRARSFIADAPEGDFIVQDFIAPERGYLTRIEIADGKIALIVKRSVAASGLSGYHQGSSYAPYSDPSSELIEDALLAARTLGFLFGSFDVIEAQGRRFFIDANSVSNVSEDCTELFGCDLMAVHARGMARRYKEIRKMRSGQQARIQQKIEGR